MLSWVQEFKWTANAMGSEAEGIVSQKIANSNVSNFSPSTKFYFLYLFRSRYGIRGYQMVKRRKIS